MTLNKGFTAGKGFVCGLCQIKLCCVLPALLLKNILQHQKCSVSIYVTVTPNTMKPLCFEKSFTTTVIEVLYWTHTSVSKV